MAIRSKSKKDKSEITLNINRGVMEILKLIPKIVGIEISGMARFVGGIEDGEITEIYFPNNSDAGGAHTTIDGTAWAMMLDGFEQQGIDATECGKVWWHSHVGIDPFPSGTDVATCYETFGWEEWGIMIITSTKGVKAYIVVIKPFKHIIPVEIITTSSIRNEDFQKKRLAVIAEMMRQTQNVPINTRIELLQTIGKEMYEEIKLALRGIIDEIKPEEETQNLPGWWHHHQRHIPRQAEQEALPLGQESFDEAFRCKSCRIILGPKDKEKRWCQACNACLGCGVFVENNEHTCTICGNKLYH